MEQSSRALLDLRPRRAGTKAREEPGRAADGTASFFTSQVHLPHAIAPRPRRWRHRQLFKPPTTVLLGCTPPLSCGIVLRDRWEWGATAAGNFEAVDADPSLRTTLWTTAVW